MHYIVFVIEILFEKRRWIMKTFRQFNKNICSGLIFCFLFSIKTEALACWGNRPLAMGGAFTGLADDTNAIYWNPGGSV
jgi:hypothetical protein